ncbi:MAG: guanylate kinase [Candidatus Tantalella remota]|nr:guanylate kinase [Candidatus Tantalella remota]
MPKKRDSIIVIVSAPSGSGKTTIVERVIEGLSNIRRSISCTTREPREGEADGADYIFLSPEEFKSRTQAGEFLEWEENFGKSYGTFRQQVTEAIEDGSDIILSIDVKGAKRVKNEFPESISVFIMPPSRGELEERLRKRNTDREKQVSLRLKESKKEIESSDEYDYLIVNKDLDQAVRELRAVIETERKNRLKTNKKENV